MESKKVITKIIDLYRFYGRIQGGEQRITPLEHALQAAELAAADGHDNEVIAAAFLHDIGYLLMLEKTSARLDDYTTASPERLGADYLMNLGFPPRIVRLVGSLIQAKRYLCTIEPGYYDQLPEQSRDSLQWQGGVMSMDEVSEFSCRKDLEEVIALRRYDEAANEPEVATDGLKDIEFILHDVLSTRVEVA